MEGMFFNQISRVNLFSGDPLIFEIEKGETCLEQRIHQLPAHAGRRSSKPVRATAAISRSSSVMQKRRSHMRANTLTKIAASRNGIGAPSGSCVSTPPLANMD